MNPLRHLAAAVLLPLLSLAALAGPPEPKHLPADAKWYIHLDVDAAKQTVLYQTALEAVRLQFPVDDVLAQVKGAIGVNPLTDIAGITVYNNSFEKDAGAVLIYATVDKDRLMGAIAQNPGHKDVPYGKHLLHSWVDNNDGKTKHGAFYGDGLIVMGDRDETLKRAIDVLDGGKPGGSALVKAPAKGAFLTAAADLAQSDDHNISQLLSNSEAATASAGETEGVFRLSLNLVAKTAEQGAQLKQLLDGVKAFAQLGAGRDLPTAASLVRQVTVGGDGAKITASFEHDAKTLLDTLQKLDQENKARQAKRAPAKAAPAKGPSDGGGGL